MPEHDAERLVDQLHGADSTPVERPSPSVGVAICREPVNMSITRPRWTATSTPTTSFGGPCSTRRRPPRSPCACPACRCASTLTVVFHGRRDLGTIQTYVDARRSRRRRGGRRPTSCCACRATSTSPTPRTARRPSTSTPSRPPRCATRWSAPTRCSTSGASRSRTSAHGRVEVDRRIALDVDLPAHRLLPAALVAPGAADRRHRRVRRPPARRGPPADGDRLRAAGRRPRLPAARRPGALPGGLPRRRRRARAPHGGAASAARRRACSASSSSRATTSPKPASAASRRPGRAMRRTRILIAHRLRGLRLPRHLGAARARPDRRRERARARCSSSLEAQARGDADAVLARAAGLPRRSRPAWQLTRDRVARAAAARGGRDPRPTGRRCSCAHAPHRRRPRRLAGRDRPPVVQCVRVRRDGSADRRRRRAARDLGADRRRGGLPCA